jgi:hypothetical protein
MLKVDEISNFPSFGQADAFGKEHAEERCIEVVEVQKDSSV